MRAFPLALIASLLALAAAGCGSSSTNGEQSKSAAAILSDSRTAAQNATAVHVVGTTSKVSLDLTIVNGKGAKGSMTQNGATFKLIRVGSTVYIQAEPRFYVQHGAAPAAAELLRGKWLKASASRPDLAGFVVLTDPAQLFARLLQPKGSPTKGGQTTVHGVKAITLTDQAASGRLYVSLVGKPYPLQLSGKGGQLNFTDWDKSVSLTAPSGAIDTSRLG
jgi:hypothetical protein